MVAIMKSKEGSRAIFEWRGAFANKELNELHSECFMRPLLENDWWTRLNTFSLGWVCMRSSGILVGFVNVAWDGGIHAFLLDTMIRSVFRRYGYGASLVEEAASKAKSLGCEWLHVDFEQHLRTFYVDACKFQPTDAGLIRL